MGQTVSVGGVGGVGGWGSINSLSPHTPHTSLSPPAPLPFCSPSPHLPIPKNNFLW
ncbi:MULTISPECIES: hypothetical protein [Nostoc]|uniref:Uncharacterized protein n=1 Tax=Nostoc paludosum FACHB-159 TaxID=2692908 RepID=A0ABR8KAJ1_9NOSO|nr:MULTISPECIES: hypothetical protein [Nostoc]MBD2736520.1 hypothetical protein [Nostoc paludosum FACHB-159]